jgi:hypothetical protein
MNKKLETWVLGGLMLGIGLAGTAWAQGDTEDTGRPQLWVNGALVAGAKTAPQDVQGDSTVGGHLGLEWWPKDIPGQNWALTAAFEGLQVGTKPSSGTDQFWELGLNFVPFQWSQLSLGAVGGIGYNNSPNAVDAHYLAYVGPELRYQVLPLLALTASVRYDATTPVKDMRSGLLGEIGVAVPLSGWRQKTPEPTPVATLVPASAKTPEPAGDTKKVPQIQAVYKVRGGDTLWTVSAKKNVYASPFKWPLLFKQNREKLPDPDLLAVGMKLSYKKDWSPEDIKKAIRAAEKTPKYKKHKHARKVLPIQY